MTSALINPQIYRWKSKLTGFDCFLDDRTLRGYVKLPARLHDAWPEPLYAELALGMVIPVLLRGPEWVGVRGSTRREVAGLTEILSAKVKAMDEWVEQGGSPAPALHLSFDELAVRQMARPYRPGVTMTALPLRDGETAWHPALGAMFVEGPCVATYFFSGSGVSLTIRRPRIKKEH